MPKRDEFGANWWAKRWIGALEAFGWDSRLARGRTYARGGRVLDVEVAPGVARARVHGSLSSPYRVTIKVTPFASGAWDRVVDVLTQRALFAAKLLAGELPAEVVDLCEAVGAPLFPRHASDLSTSCTCPDWGDPCKHVAAVHYVLAAELDRDPFLLFRLRGRTREELIADLRARRGAGAPEVPEAELEEPTEPLEPHLDRFWEAGPELALLEVEVRPPVVPFAVLRRLGRPPVWGPPDQFVASLEHLYRVASTTARDVALGEPTGDGDV